MILPGLPATCGVEFGAGFYVELGLLVIEFGKRNGVYVVGTCCNAKRGASACTTACGTYVLRPRN